MKIKIINADSEHAKHRIGQERYIQFLGNKLVMQYTDDSGKMAITSEIENITIKTKNTTYEMEAVKEDQ